MLSIYIFLLAPSSAPRSCIIKFLNATQIHLTWSAPAREHHNGILTKYQLEFLPESWSSSSKRIILLPAKTKFHKEKNLQPYMRYVIHLRAKTIAGVGPSAILNARTFMAGKNIFV